MTKAFLNSEIGASFLLKKCFTVPHKLKILELIDFEFTSCIGSQSSSSLTLKECLLRKLKYSRSFFRSIAVIPFLLTRIQNFFFSDSQVEIPAKNLAVYNNSYFLKGGFDKLQGNVKDVINMLKLKQEKKHLAKLVGALDNL